MNYGRACLPKNQRLRAGRVDACSTIFCKVPKCTFRRTSETQSTMWRSGNCFWMKSDTSVTRLESAAGLSASARAGGKSSCISCAPNRKKKNYIIFFKTTRGRPIGPTPGPIYIYNIYMYPMNASWPPLALHCSPAAQRCLQMAGPEWALKQVRWELALLLVGPNLSSDRTIFRFYKAPTKQFSGSTTKS